jgi:hypothetical protein
MPQKEAGLLDEGNFYGDKSDTQRREINGSVPGWWFGDLSLESN